jgi:hypothetical protein
LLPHTTTGAFGHIRAISLCQFGTFLNVTLSVTSNMMIAQWLLMLCRMEEGKQKNASQSESSHNEKSQNPKGNVVVEERGRK